MIRRRGFLGAALAGAAAGCLGAGPGTPLQGELVGANVRLGHQLGKLRETRFRGRRQELEVLIAGGGVAGLSAAWRLQHGGVEDFAVLDLERQLGGNSRAQHYVGHSWAPWGAHYLPVPTRESLAVQRLLRELGLLTGFDAAGRPLYSELDLCHTPEERLFAFGDWEEGLFPRFGASPEEIAQLRSFDAHVQGWQSWRDKQGRKAFAIPVEFSSRDPELMALDRQSMAAYMTERGWTSPRLRWYVEYGCRDDYGTSLEQTSAWAGLHYFVSRDGGGFQPADAQFVWPEGNQRLVKHLLGRCGPRAQGRQLVVRLEQHGQAWQADVWDEAARQMLGYQARFLIYALPSFQRPHVLRQPAPEGFSYSPWTVSNLVLRSTPPSAHAPRVGLCWDNVLYGSPSLGYVVATHQTSSRRNGPSVWTHYRPWTELEPGAARAQMLRASWSEVSHSVMADLMAVHPDLPEHCLRLDVMQLGHAMVRPTPGFLWGASRRQAWKSTEPGLYFAHSDLSGLSIFEEANFQGVRAAQELLADRGRAGEDYLRA